MYAFDGKLVTLKSGEVPSNQKVSWETQAEFHLRQLETLKQTYKNIVTVIDATGVGTEWYPHLDRNDSTSTIRFATCSD